MMIHLTYTLQKINQLAEPSATKLVSSAILSTVLFLFGSLYEQALVAIVMLMIFDTILGIAAAKYFEDEAITSRKFARFLFKGIVYLTAISAGHFADTTIPFDFIQGTMIAFVGVTEFISILENIGRMGYQTPNKLLNNLKDYRNSK